MAHSDCRRTCGCAGKTVKSLENTCHTWALLRWWITTKRRYIKCMHLFTFMRNVCLQMDAIFHLPDNKWAYVITVYVQWSSLAGAASRITAQQTAAGWQSLCTAGFVSQAGVICGKWVGWAVSTWLVSSSSHWPVVIWPTRILLPDWWKPSYMVCSTVTCSDAYVSHVRHIMSDFA